MNDVTFRITTQTMSDYRTYEVSQGTMASGHGTYVRVTDNNDHRAAVTISEKDFRILRLIFSGGVL